VTKKLLAVIFALVSVPLLTVLLNRNPDPSPFLVYALLPGIIVSLLITGGHGGTLIEERVGLIAGLIVNSLVYAGAVFLLLRMRRPSK
jgi:hypothetical protein